MGPIMRMLKLKEMHYVYALSVNKKIGVICRPPQYLWVKIPKTKISKTVIFRLKKFRDITQ